MTCFQVELFYAPHARGHVTMCEGTWEGGLSSLDSITGIWCIEVMDIVNKL